MKKKQTIRSIKYQVYLPHIDNDIIAENSEYQESEFESYSSPAYLSINIKAMSINVFRDMQSKFNIKIDSNALELGGGYGYLSAYLKATNTKLNITYSDPAVEAVKKSAQFELFYKSKIDRKVVCTAETTPFDDKSFKTVFMFSSFHHVQDPIATCKEISRVLKKNGKAYLLYEPSSPRYLQFIYSRHSSRDNIEEKFYSIREYKKFFHQAGLKAAVKPYKNPNFRWKRSATLYYSLVSLLPDIFFLFLPCSVIIEARKS